MTDKPNEPMLPWELLAVEEPFDFDGCELVNGTYPSEPNRAFEFSPDEVKYIKRAIALMEQE